MLIPKWSLRALLLLSAAFLGWMLHVSMGDGPEHSAPQAAATRREPASHAAAPQRGAGERRFGPSSTAGLRLRGQGRDGNQCEQSSRCLVAG